MPQQTSEGPVKSRSRANFAQPDRELAIRLHVFGMTFSRQSTRYLIQDEESLVQVGGALLCNTARLPINLHTSRVDGIHIH